MWVPRFERIEESMAGWDEAMNVRLCELLTRRSRSEKRLWVRETEMHVGSFPILCSPTCTTKDRDSSAYIKPNMQIIFPGTHHHQPPPRYARIHCRILGLYSETGV